MLFFRRVACSSSIAARHRGSASALLKLLGTGDSGVALNRAGIRKPLFARVATGCWLLIGGTTTAPLGKGAEEAVVRADDVGRADEDAGAARGSAGIK